jgi:hypothetical protein
MSASTGTAKIAFKNLVFAGALMIECCPALRRRV